MKYISITEKQVEVYLPDGSTEQKDTNGVVISALQIDMIGRSIICGLFYIYKTTGWDIVNLYKNSYIITGADFENIISNSNGFESAIYNYINTEESFIGGSVETL